MRLDPRYVAGWTVIAGYVVLVVAMVPAFLESGEGDQARELGFLLLFSL